MIEMSARVCETRHFPPIRVSRRLAALRLIQSGANLNSRRHRIASSSTGMTTMNAAEEILRPALERGLGNRTALISGANAVSYSELSAAVNRFGNALKGAGIERENRVLLMLNDSPELVSAYLGAMRIGAVAIAFNTRSSPADVEHALNDSRARALILDEQFIPVYQAIAANIGWKLTVIVAGINSAPFPNFDSFIAGQSPELASEPMSPDDMAFWIYTSGTTGTPKAAVHLHHDVLSAGPHLAYLVPRDGDRFFSISRLFFAYALGNCLFGSLRLCGTTILHRSWPDVDSVARVIAETCPNLVFSVPTMYRNILRSGRAGEPGFKSVRGYVSAGERLPGALAENWRRATGVRIFEGMGTSETIYMILTNSPDMYRPGSSGRVAPTAEVKLLDEDERPVTEPHRPGVLWARMPSVCDRYWNQQENSNRAFFGPWFRTGDLYSFDEDGFYYQHGRADEMLKISGQWVSPLEIEECAMTSPQVADAAVVGTPNDDGLMRLSLFLVARGAANPDRLAAEVRELLISTLSVYKCPRDIRFVERLPRTATGKLQRYLLRRTTQEKSGAGGDV